MEENEVRSFEEALKSFVEGRTLEDFAPLYYSNEEYSLLSSEIEEHCEKLIAFVGEERKEEFTDCLEKYYDAIMNRQGVTYEILYLQALKDGIKLGRVLKLDEGGA